MDLSTKKERTHIKPLKKRPLRESENAPEIVSSPPRRVKDDLSMSPPSLSVPHIKQSPPSSPSIERSTEESPFSVPVDHQQLRPAIGQGSQPTVLYLPNVIIPQSVHLDGKRIASHGHHLLFPVPLLRHVESSQTIPWMSMGPVGNSSTTSGQPTLYSCLPTSDLLAKQPSSLLTRVPALHDPSSIVGFLHPGHTSHHAKNNFQQPHQDQIVRLVEPPQASHQTDFDNSPINLADNHSNRNFSKFKDKNNEKEQLSSKGHVKNESLDETPRVVASKPKPGSHRQAGDRRSVHGDVPEGEMVSNLPSAASRETDRCSTLSRIGDEAKADKYKNSFSQRIEEQEANRSEKLSRCQKLAKEIGIDPHDIDKIINMAIEDFQEYGVANNFTDDQMAKLRKIRRSAKNNIAAQNCRKKKEEGIERMETEVCGRSSRLKEKMESIKKQREETIKVLNNLKDIGKVILCRKCNENLEKENFSEHIDHDDHLELCVNRHQTVA